MKKMNRLDILAYAQLAFPLAFAGLPLYIHTPDFYATNYGISLSFLGGALLTIRLIDAFADPLIGRFCDVYSHRRTIIMSIAAVFFALAFGALYQPLPENEAMWFVVTALVATLSFSVLIINLNAIGGIIAASDAEKTSTSAWREGFGVAGLMAAMILPAVFTEMKTYAIFCAACMIVSAVFFILWYYKKNILVSGKPIKLPIKKIFSSPFKSFFAAYGISMIASSFPAVLVLFFIRDWLGAEEKVGVFLLIYFISAILSMPLWRLLSYKTSPTKLWIYSMCVSVVGISLAALAQPQDLFLYAFVCILSGIGFGGEIFLPPTILSSRISRAGLDAHTSSYFGIYAFFMKAALSLATAISFVALDYTGFKPGAEHGCCGLATLVGLYAIAPAVIKLFAVFILLRTGVHNEKTTHSLHIGDHHAS